MDATVCVGVCEGVSDAGATGQGRADAAPPLPASTTVVAECDGGTAAGNLCAGAGGLWPGCGDAGQEPTGGELGQSVADAGSRIDGVSGSHRATVRGSSGPQPVRESAGG